LNGALVQLIGISVAAGTCGIAIGYFISSTLSRRRESHTLLEAYRQAREAGTARDKAIARYQSAKVAVHSARKHVDDALGQRAAALEKLVTMQEAIKKFRMERAATIHKVKILKNSLSHVHERSMTLQRESVRADRAYKREMAQALKERERLQAELKNSLAEQEAFRKRIKESVLEHASPEDMVTAARLRLGQIDMLERSNARLESENAALKKDIRRQESDFEALQKQLDELGELRIYNQQLVRAVETLEQSRQQHEQEAEQFRSQADESEQLSETLRMRLTSLQQNFAAIEQARNGTANDIQLTKPHAAANQDADESGVVDIAG
jgi:predicted  nucleic acid-binding Zn-ribbon protein